MGGDRRKNNKAFKQAEFIKSLQCIGSLYAHITANERHQMEIERTIS